MKVVMDADSLIKLTKAKAKEVGEVIARLKMGGGEADAFRLYKSGGFDAVSSDDAKFLKILDAFDMPYLTLELLPL